MANVSFYGDQQFPLEMHKVRIIHTLATNRGAAFGDGRGWL